MQDLFHSFTTLSLALITIFSGTHPAVPTTVPTPSVQPTHVQRMVVAKGTLSKYGQTIDFAFSFPANGGKVSGTIDGICSGPITGQYTGGRKGLLTGKAKATCSLLFSTFTGSATFHTDLDRDSHSLTLPVHVTAQDIDQDMQIPLEISSK